MTGKGGWVESPEPRRSQTRAPRHSHNFFLRPEILGKAMR